MRFTCDSRYLILQTVPNKTGTRVQAFRSLADGAFWQFLARKAGLCRETNENIVVAAAR